MRKITYFLILAISAIFLNNCSKKEDESEILTSLFFNNDFGAVANRDFMGQVLDIQGSPLSGVTITVGTSNKTNDGRGFFIINDAPVKERFAIVKANKAGYLEGSRSMIPLTGMNILKITLLADTPTATVTSGSPSEVALSNGAKVLFDGKFKTEAGVAYNGSVKVSLNHLDPTKSSTFDKMPGMLLGENTKGKVGVLESFGMLNIVLTGSNGEKLQPNTTATLEFPIASAQQANAATTIPLWHFDSTKGYWVEEGFATKTGTKYKGTISHFSWWNVDNFANSVSLKITLLDCNNKPIDNVAAQLVPSTQNYGNRIGYTNSAGEVSGIVPSDETLVLNVYSTIKGCENQVIYTQTILPLSQSANELVITVPCTENLKNVLIEGTLNNCNDSKVTNGYVWMQYGEQYFNTPVTDGLFRFNAVICSTAAISIIIQGVDIDTQKESNIINKSYTGLNLDVGTLKTCTDAQTTVIDIDGHVYPIVKIGSQNWTQTNLDVSKYRNGDVIPQVTDPTVWANLTTGAWCYYNNENANGAIYGKLYNWYAVNDPRGLAPVGYHIPNNEEWTTLITYLGGINVAGNKMKTATVWSPYLGITNTNSSGFTGLPGGYRESKGIFYDFLGSIGNWWSATEYDATSAWYRNLNYSDSNVFDYYYYKELGLSVRCLRD